MSSKDKAENRFVARSIKSTENYILMEGDNIARCTSGDIVQGSKEYVKSVAAEFNSGDLSGVTKVLEDCTFVCSPFVVAVRVDGIYHKVTRATTKEQELLYVIEEGESPLIKAPATTEQLKTYGIPESPRDALQFFRLNELKESKLALDTLLEISFRTDWTGTTHLYYQEKRVKELSNISISLDGCIVTSVSKYLTPMQKLLTHMINSKSPRAFMAEKLNYKNLCIVDEDGELSDLYIYGSYVIEI